MHKPKLGRGQPSILFFILKKKVEIKHKINAMHMQNRN
jgi:hypothetical protein